MTESLLRLPTNRQRVAIIGRTGSGKTVFGAWILSRAPFDKQPYIIVDYKGDDLLNSIARVPELRVGEIPKQPGLYIVHPRVDEEIEVNDWLWKIWAHEQIGLYFDEGYNVPSPLKRNAFASILTQGRSKRIPAIILTQRPSWISRFVFSEADFFAVFHLNQDDDKRKVEGMLSKSVLADDLPEFHSNWYDVGKARALTLAPVPDGDTIRNDIEARLKPRRNFV